MKRCTWLIAIALLGASSPGVCSEPLERLGTLTQWFLTFANDPYDSPSLELGDLRPELAARALLEGVTFPEGGANDELIERWSKLGPKDLPRSLRNFIELESRRWLRSQGEARLSVRLVKGPIDNATTPSRRGKRIDLPIPAIARDLFRAMDRDGSQFRLYMWSLSHPTFSARRATRRSSDFWLTGACVVSLPGDGGGPCGGSAFYRANQPDIASACSSVQNSLAARLGQTLEAALK